MGRVREGRGAKGHASSWLASLALDDEDAAPDERVGGEVVEFRLITGAEAVWGTGGRRRGVERCGRGERGACHVQPWASQA